MLYELLGGLHPVRRRAPRRGAAPPCHRDRRAAARAARRAVAAPGPVPGQGARLPAQGGRARRRGCASCCPTWPGCRRSTWPRPATERGRAAQTPYGDDPDEPPLPPSSFSGPGSRLRPGAAGPPALGAQARRRTAGARRRPGLQPRHPHQHQAAHRRGTGAFGAARAATARASAPDRAGQPPAPRGVRRAAPRRIKRRGRGRRRARRGGTRRLGHRLRGRPPASPGHSAPDPGGTSPTTGCPPRARHRATAATRHPDRPHRRRRLPAGPHRRRPSTLPQLVRLPARRAAAVALTGGPRARARSAGATYVFARGADKNIWYVVRDAVRATAPWHKLTGIHVEDDPAVVSARPGRIDLFARRHRRPALPPHPRLRRLGALVPGRRAHPLRRRPRRRLLRARPDRPGRPGRRRPRDRLPGRRPLERLGAWCPPPAASPSAPALVSRRARHPRRLRRAQGRRRGAAAAVLRRRVAAHPGRRPGWTPRGRPEALAAGGRLYVVRRRERRPSLGPASALPAGAHGTARRRRPRRAPWSSSAARRTAPSAVPPPGRCGPPADRTDAEGGPRESAARAQPAGRLGPWRSSTYPKS